MSQKTTIKPKIIISDPHQSSASFQKEVIITIPPNVNLQPIKTLVPEVVKSDPVSDHEGDATDEELSEPDEDVVDEESKNTQKRRQRTKKDYPPTEEMFDQLVKSLCEQREITRKIITLAREAQKAMKKELKDLNIKIKKEKNENPTRKPRGFALPSPISDEMVDYLLNIVKVTDIDRKINDNSSTNVVIQYGCLLARNELTSVLCNHFKSSAMIKNSQDKRDIHLDPQTTKLFGIDLNKFKEEGGRLSTNGDPIITYFDLQKYLPRHCGKLVGSNRTPP